MNEDGQVRAWTGQAASPFKNKKTSALRSVPGGDLVGTIKPDLMHTFNLGFGQDLAAGGVLAVVRMGVWAGRSIDAKLALACESFDGWCVSHGKTSSVKSFELGKFKIKAPLGPACKPISIAVGLDHRQTLNVEGNLFN